MTTVPSEWQRFKSDGDRRAALREHLGAIAKSSIGQELVERLAGTAQKIEVSSFERTRGVQEPALLITLPEMEDGKQLDEDGEGATVKLFLLLPLLGPLAPMPASLTALVKTHNGMSVMRNDEYIAIFGGIDSTGGVDDTGSLTDATFAPDYLDALPSWARTSTGDAAAIDCLPNGWAVFDGRPDERGEGRLRWMSEEVRKPGDILWAGSTLGERVLLVVLATALGFHPKHLSDSQ